MAQKGDTFSSPTNFGKATPFDTPATQLIPSFSAESYQGRILRYWGDALGTTPDASLVTGLKIAGLGAPGLPPKPGTSDASLFAYIKQIEIDLAGVKIDTASLEIKLGLLTTSVATIETAIDSIEARVTVIQTSSAAIKTSVEASTISSAAIANLSQTISGQQAQIITLLTAIRDKP